MENTAKSAQNFEYTYSAKNQKEIDDIRKKYLPKEEDKMETLRRLDREAERPGVTVALAIGIVGALILGTGMCCTMVWNNSIAVFVVGILVGIIGMVMVGMAYPMYKKITKKQREKIADQILALSSELSM